MSTAQRVVLTIGLAVGLLLAGAAALPIALGGDASSGHLTGLGLFAVLDIVWTGLAVLLFDDGD